MATSSARLRAFVSFDNSSIPSFTSSTSAAASKTSQRVWRSVITAAFAVWLLLGASVTGQAQTDVQSASPAQAALPTRSVEQTPRVIPPPMSFPRADISRTIRRHGASFFQNGIDERPDPRGLPIRRLRLPSAGPGNSGPL